jgi:hypothetical protein
MEYKSICENLYAFVTPILDSFIGAFACPYMV